MKIYLLDDKRITKCDLPVKVEEDFLINYSDEDNEKENMLTVTAKEGKWSVRSNGSINIINGENIEYEVILNDYSYHYLKVLGKTGYVVLFPMPSQESELYSLSYFGVEQIKIGNSPEANICYTNQLTTPENALIYRSNDEWYIKAGDDIKLPVFVNDSKYQSKKLKYGDVIFINGLKIIWMRDYIKINNPGKTVTVRGLAAHNDSLSVDNSYTPVNDEENNVVLYTENDYFYHIPRVREVLRDQAIGIDAPPPSQVTGETPLWMTFATSLTMYASSAVTAYNLIERIQAGGTFIKLLPQIITLFSLIVGSLLMPRIIKAYQKKMQKKREALRQSKYRAYLAKKDEQIKANMKHQLDVLLENNISTQECYNSALNKDRNLWSREIADDDFLNIRLGIGDFRSKLEVNAPQEKFDMSADELTEAAIKIADESRIIYNAPIVYSLLENNIASFIFNCTYKYDYIKGLIAQVATYHSGNDLKIVVFTNKYNQNNWEYVKILPHCWNDDKSVRFYSTSVEEANQLSVTLEEELKKRKNQLSGKSDDVSTEEFDKAAGFLNFSPYYLIITDDYREIKNCPFIINLLKEKTNLGFSFVTIADSMKNLPPRSEKFIQISEKTGCILSRDLNNDTKSEFNIEYIPGIDMELLSTKLANIPLLSKEGLTSLPQSLTFLEMFNVSKIEQLNILNRWQVNNPVSSLAVTIGVHSNLEPFKLDLHEKFHGPHGLIAGSTGSGKSEFIITFILSMALNYHPYEVQFVLIDYKGGGLAGAFENRETGTRLPHLIGTITNLDTSEMNRTLVSIESELKRRQRIFNKVRDSLGESTIDIYKYQRLYREGTVKEPMAHLFIVSDEFAELKSQQPEFMAQLISTARIGRSLGVHLILATQKPSGVVNDQIWSNSKFKICLKVQDKGDSMEMLKRPEAASIKEAGRFYLQVGYDDYFDIGQSGWSGAKYIPSNKIIKKNDDSMAFVNNVGYVIKTVNDEKKADEEAEKSTGDQLTNTVKYICNLGIKENIVTRKLWLDKIPSEINILDTKKKYNYSPIPYVIAPAIGEYDNPAGQEQGILNLDLTNGGNTVIYGQSGSGKENLLATILWSSITEHTPDEVNFYIIDCGAETLKMFYKMPHVGEIANIDDADKIIDILKMIGEELERRKDLFADYAGSYQNYLENSGEKLPQIVCIINAFDNFSETYAKVVDTIMPFYRECVKYGVIFIVTTATATAIRAKMAQSFSNKISMQLQNDSDYRNVIGSPKNLFPAKNFGRGIAYKGGAFYEFQTANIADSKQMNNVIKAAAEKLNQVYKTRAKKIFTIPAVANLGLFKEAFGDIHKIPIGYDVESKEIAKYDFMDNKINIVAANDMSGKLSFLNAVVRMMSMIPNTKCTIIDFVGAIDINIPNVEVISDNFDQAFVNINNEMVNEKDNSFTHIYFMVAVGFYKKKISDGAKPIFTKVLESANSCVNTSFIILDEYVSLKTLKLENWYRSQVDATSGIWLGEGVGDQLTISITGLSLDDKKKVFDDIAFAVNKGKRTIVKAVVDEPIEIEQEVQQ